MASQLTLSACGEKFLMMPINKWDADYQRVVLGGITCDSHDYYDSEEHINEVFLPKVDDGGEPLFVGFFHTGAYQDQISGYGGIKHCLIPSPKHIIVGPDKNGKLVVLYASNKETQHGYIEIAQEKGYQVLFLDSPIVSHLIQKLESDKENLSFVRVDSDHVDKLIQKEDTQISKLSEEEATKLKTVYIIGETSLWIIFKVNENYRNIVCGSVLKT